MAYTINEQPPAVAFARTPILYLVTEDTLYNEEAFQYIADVYLWQGLIGDKPVTPEYELRKPSNNTSGNALFDLHTLTTDWLITPEFAIGNNPDKTTEMYVWCQVEFRYIYIDTGGSIVELPKGSGQQSNNINVYNGYNYYMEGVNHYPGDHLGIDYISEYQQRVIEAGGVAEALECIPIEIQRLTGGGFWMTNKPLVNCVPENTSMYIFALNDSASPVRKVYVSVNEGEYVSVLDLDTYHSQVVAIGCGSKEIFEGAFSPAGTEIISWEIYGATSGGAQATFKYKFTICEPCKHGFINLQFLNRFGVWDNLICYGSKMDSMTVERSETLHSPLEIINNSFSFLKPFGQFHAANIHGREMKTVNTGWIKEDWNELLKQFMLTQYLYDADTLQPYTLDMKSIQYKTALIDGLSQYTIKLKRAHTAVGTTA